MDTAYEENQNSKATSKNTRYDLGMVLRLAKPSKGTGGGRLGWLEPEDELEGAIRDRGGCGVTEGVFVSDDCATGVLTRLAA